MYRVKQPLACIDRRHEVSVDGDVHGVESNVYSRASQGSGQSDTSSGLDNSSEDRLGLRSELRQGTTTYLHTAQLLVESLLMHWCNGSGAVVHLLQCARGLGLQLPFGIAVVGVSLWRHFHLHFWFYFYHTNLGKVFRSTSQRENFLHRFVKPLCSYLVQKPELHTITITHTPLVTYTVITSWLVLSEVLFAECKIRLR